MCLPLSNSITGVFKNRPSIAAIFNKSSRSTYSEVLISFLIESNNWMNINANIKHGRRASSEILTYLKHKQLILWFKKALLSGLYCLYLACSSFISELWYVYIWSRLKPPNETFWRAHYIFLGSGSEISSVRSALQFQKGWASAWAWKYVTEWGGNLHKKLRSFLWKKVPCPSYPIVTSAGCQSTSVHYMEPALPALHTLGERHWNSFLPEYLGCLQGRPQSTSHPDSL